MPQISNGETGASARSKINRIVGLNIRIVSGASYTIVADDHARLLLFTSASPVNVTVPVGLPTDFACRLAQMGSGSVTISAGGTTVYSFGALALAGQYAKAELYCTALNQFLLTAGSGTSAPPSDISLTEITSAGVINSSGQLVRTLWVAEAGRADRNNPVWDGTIEDGSVAPTGNYVIKVLSHNITYTYEGAVGNTSPDHSTVRYHAYGSCIRDLCVTDANEIYFTTVYDERIQTLRVTTTTDIQNSDTAVPPQGFRQQIIAPHLVCTDGTITYFGLQEGASSSGVIGVTCATHAYHVFSGGTTIGTLSYLGLRTDASYAAIIKGLAVQKTGSFIFLGRPDLGGGTIHVHNKTTGVLAQTFTGLAHAARLASNPTTITQLWVAYSASGGVVSDRVVKCAVDGSGVITTTATIITCQNALAMAISPDGATLLIADGGTSQQIKAFNTSDGSVKTAWGTSGTLGVAGGYLNSPAITNTKFMFYAGSDMGSLGPQSFLAYQPDGKFWIGDVGNHRYMRFSAGNAPAYVDHFGYIPGFYGCRVCNNDPTRVMIGALEFQIHKMKPLSPTNGSWIPVRNWLADVVAAGGQGTGYTAANFFGTYSNGRTYATWDLPGVAMRRWFELTSSGLRSTGWNTTPPSHVDEQTLDLYWIDGAQSGQIFRMYRNPFTGFDGSNNPTWRDNTGPEAGGTTALDPSDLIFTSTTLPAMFPRTRGYDNNAPFPTRKPTLNNILPFYDPNTGDGYGWVSNHFGGIDATTGAVKFNLHYPDPPNHGGRGKWCLLFPDPPAIPYNIYYGGGPIFYQPGHEHVFTNFNGEEWGNNQTNVWTHWHDSGIAIAQFGPAAPYFGAYSLRYPDAFGDNIPASDPFSFLGLDGMAGNCRWGGFAYTGGKYYIYQNDEWYHCGFVRWRVDGLSTFNVHTHSINWNSGTYTPLVDPTDMLAGLPLSGSLVEGTGGWHRTDADQTAPQVFTISSGVVAVDRRKPDLALETVIANTTVGLGDGNSHGAWRAIPRVGSGNWTVRGSIIMYPGAGLPQGNPNIEGNIYLEVLDGTGKCIVRFHGYTKEQEAANDSLSGGAIKVNGIDLFTIIPSERKTRALMGARQPFSIAANVGAGTFLVSYGLKFATYSNTISGVAEAGAAIGSPARVQLVYRNLPGKNPFREVHACLTELKYIELS